MILRSAHRGSIFFILFVIFVVALLLHRSQLLLGLLFEDGLEDAIYPADIPPLDSNETFVQLIPKIIHQTYKNETIPQHWRAGQQVVKALHPDWEYMFWTDDTALSFIQTHYPTHLRTYSAYAHPIQRADALRYFVLHHFGGVYLDLDIAPYRPLDPLLAYPGFACRTAPTGISNDVLGSVPGHQFFEHVINNLGTYDRNWLVGYITIMYSTGPLFLSVMWVEYRHSLRGRLGNGRIGTDRIRLLGRDGGLGDSYGFFNNVKGGSWHGKDTEMIFWMGRHWIIVTVLGFVIGFGVTGVLWWVLKRAVGWWNRSGKKRNRKTWSEAA